MYKILYRIGIRFCFEEMIKISKTKCVDCKYLGIKDFICGYCTNPKSDMKIVNPDDSCEWGELKNDL